MLPDKLKKINSISASADLFDFWGETYLTSPSPIYIWQMYLVKVTGTICEEVVLLHTKDIQFYIGAGWNGLRMDPQK